MQNSTITSLDLSFCPFGDIGVVQLCEVLKVNFSLISLNLTCTKISDIAAKSLSRALEINSTLASLNVRENMIRDEGLSDLSNALIRNQTLTFLHFGNPHPSYLKAICVVSSEDKWIVRKNLRLYDLLFQYLKTEFGMF